MDHRQIHFRLFEQSERSHCNNTLCKFVNQCGKYIYLNWIFLSLSSIYGSYWVLAYFHCNSIMLSNGLHFLWILWFYWLNLDNVKPIRGLGFLSLWGVVLISMLSVFLLHSPRTYRFMKKECCWLFLTRNHEWHGSSSSSSPVNRSWHRLGYVMRHSA